MTPLREPARPRGGRGATGGLSGARAQRECDVPPRLEVRRRARQMITTRHRADDVDPQAGPPIPDRSTSAAFRKTNCAENRCSTEPIEHLLDFPIRAPEPTTALLRRSPPENSSRCFHRTTRISIDLSTREQSGIRTESRHSSRPSRLLRLERAVYLLAASVDGIDRDRNARNPNLGTTTHQKRAPPARAAAWSVGQVVGNRTMTKANTGPAVHQQNPDDQKPDSPQPHVKSQRRPLCHPLHALVK